MDRNRNRVTGPDVQGQTDMNKEEGQEHGQEHGQDRERGTGGQGQDRDST